jgi:adenine deaminase
MDKAELKKLIGVAAGRIPADLVIRGSTVADVYGGGFFKGDIAVTGGLIAGIGNRYEGAVVVDLQGGYILPGFIDSHIHIESSLVSPEELGRLIVPHGSATIIADPHEIVNVAGTAGLDYMIRAARETALDVKYMLPSCVPATPWEHSGAVFDAAAMVEAIADPRILGLGEFMQFGGVINGEDAALDKLILAIKHGKIVDGHSPGVSGKRLSAYAAARIHTDHECATAGELRERITQGMYVQLRQGSACEDLRRLLRGLTPENARRCVLCSDDRQPKTIFERGHLDDHLRICVEEGVDPMTAIRMATLNAAECYRLSDRGALAPGLRADMVLVDNLRDFPVRKVWIAGTLTAQEGRYLLPVTRCDDRAVRATVRVKDWTKERLRLLLRNDDVWVIDMSPETVVTGKGRARVMRDAAGNFVYDPAADIAKIAVVERHQLTGNVAVALVRGYGIKHGAIALSIAHDSHNIIVASVNDGDMFLAVSRLVELGGGIVLARDGKVIEEMPLPLGGIMSDQSGAWVNVRLAAIHEAAHRQLGVNPRLDPAMSLCFMSLAVIPALKLTDMGLFDTEKGAFIPVEVCNEP